jgi:hypothetical protein
MKSDKDGFAAVVISTRSPPKWGYFWRAHGMIKQPWIDTLNLSGDPIPFDALTIHEEVLVLRRLRMEDGRVIPVYAPEDMSARAATVIIEEWEERREAVAPLPWETH